MESGLRRKNSVPKIIFLSKSYVVSYKADRLWSALLGVLFLTMGVGAFIRAGDFFKEPFFITIYLLQGIALLVYAVILLSPKFRYAPRFEFDQNSILIKNRIFSKVYVIELLAVKAIKYGSYEVTFMDIEGRTVTFPIFSKQAENSIAIKEEITKRAQALEIEVIAG